MRLGDPKAQVAVETVPTGALSSGYIALTGIVQRGTEIFRPESSGQTTVALHMIAEVQKEGDWQDIIDASMRDPLYAGEYRRGYQ